MPSVMSSPVCQLSLRANLQMRQVEGTLKYPPICCDNPHRRPAQSFNNRSLSDVCSGFLGRAEQLTILCLTLKRFSFFF